MAELPFTSILCDSKLQHILSVIVEGQRTTHNQLLQSNQKKKKN